MSDESRRQIDALLEPYEQRGPTTAPRTEQQRREGLAVGWQLNRLQGGEQHWAGSRLDALWVTGRIDDREYLQIARQLAHLDLLTVEAEAVDGR